MITVALTIVPLLGAALGLAFSRFPRLRPYQWTPDALGCAVAAALAIAVLAGAGRDEALFGAWFPVSVLGELLVVKVDAAGAAIIAALALAQFSAALTRRSASWARVVAAAAFGALVLACSANSLIGLLAGVGLADMFTVARRFLRGENTGRVAADALLWGLSLTCLVMAAASLTSATTSLYFPLTLFSARQTGFLSAAVLLRYVVVLARDTRSSDPDLARYDSDLWATQAAALAGLIVLMRLPQLGAPPLPDWILAAGLVAGLIQLARAAFDPRESRAARRGLSGLLALALVSAATWQTTPMAAAIVAFILGAGLLRRSYSSLLSVPILRGVIVFAIALGGAVLAGVPLTPGFIARAGALDALIGRSGGIAGALLALSWTVAHALLVVFSLRSVAGLEERVSETRIGAVWALAATALLVASVLAVGLFPGLMGGGLGAAFSAAGGAGWLTWALGVSLGIGLWALRGRIPEAAKTAGRGVFGFLSLRWITGPLNGALTRLSGPFASIFVVFESDGALIWLVALSLVIVLIGRNPGP